MKTSAQEYLERLSEIQSSSTTRLVMLPADEPRFIIDSDSRKISIPEEFTFLGVKNDSRAETIYFEIDRYFDNVDLSGHTCVVQYASARDGKTGAIAEGICPISMLDVNTIPGKIIFGWPVTNDVTAYSTDVHFSVRFYSLTTTAPITFAYCFNTLPAVLPVKDTLDVSNSIGERYPALFEEWNARMQSMANYANDALGAVRQIQNQIESSSSATLTQLQAALASAEAAKAQYDAFLVEAKNQARQIAQETVNEAYPQYDTLVANINAMGELVDQLNAEVETYTAIKNNLMLNSVYDRNNRNADIFDFAAAQAQAVKIDVTRTVEALSAIVQNIQNNIVAAYELSWGGTSFETLPGVEETTPSHSYNVNTLKSALNSIVTAFDEDMKDFFLKAKNYTNAALVNYKAFTTKIVSALPIVGEVMTFYLVEKDSGYEKYWWVADVDGQYFWDSFGSSSTLVLDELPEEGATDVDYIIKNGDGYVYWKWIDNQWKVVAGSMVVLCPAYTDEEGVKHDGDLPENGNELTDYYVETANGSYRHYRWFNNDYVMTGGDIANDADFVAVKQQVENVLRSSQRNSDSIESLETNVISLNNAVTNLQQALSNLNTEGTLYDLVLTKDEETGNNILTLVEIVEGVESPKSTIILPAGGGGGTGPSSSVVLNVEKITPSPLIVTPSDDAKLQVSLSAVDADGEAVDCTYTLKMGNNIIFSGVMAQGLNTFDIKDYLSIGTQKFVLTVTAEGGSMAVKNWTVQKVDVRIESSFNDRYTFGIDRTVNFTYTPYGALPKTVHFKLDGVEIGTVNTSTSGTLQSYPIPAQEHGSHLLECYITATINNVAVETEHIYKDIIWYDESSDVPVIGCAYRFDYYGAVSAKQYDSTSIPYVVYDPSTNSPRVSLKVDNETYSNLTLNDAYNVWTYKTADIGTHVLTITCGDVSVTIKVNVAELGIDIEPITANLEFDFNPSGLSNSSADRLWHDKNTDVDMSVSSNFDWSNGGYQIDADGNQYFCVKAGTYATINCKVFENDPTIYGAEFKMIFRTTNVRKADAEFLRCMETVTTEGGEETNVGLQMFVHEAYLHSNTSSLYMPYSEDDRIELEWNINTIDKDDTEATGLIMSYEDGVGYRPMLYSNGVRLYQYTPDVIHIGSDDCDVHIYRMKMYSASLTDSNILNNFIADALDADTMIARYNRNQIYDENNALTPDSVAAACPDLRIIKIEAPHFTNDKKDFVRGTSIECIYKNGDNVLDNWKFVNCYHAGQGTTSNEYGYAGRNIDVLCCFDGIHPANDKIALDPSYITELTLGDGTKFTDGTGKIALTRTSVPNNWFNIKVNVASSEMANNALLQKRYNDYLPYTTLAQKRNPYCKNSMEFVNCVIFVKESDPDISTHREFTDTDWHFYSLGNIGDSKKTDYSRAYDQTDMNEFVVEISDNTLNNSTFQTGVKDETGKMVYPITKEQWEAEGNEARTALYDDWDGSFEFRYDCCGDSKDGAAISSSEELKAQRAKNRQVWREFYEWVITSTDEQFVSELSDWCVESSMLYWYLFTERRTMIDNRAKNTFWHFARTDTFRAVKRPTSGMLHVYRELVDNEYVPTTDVAIIPGKTYYCEYAFDMWDYDNDTALGINNSGELAMTYGKEDIDYKIDGDPSSGYIFNAAESTFWCRIRDLMPTRLNTMYQSINANCWKASHLIDEFDRWQEQFPEELWRIHYDRVYYRTYQGGGLNGGKPATPTKRFLEEMMNGRKKYQRRQFERDQEAYCGTKHLVSDIRSDQIMFRCNTPTGSNIAVTPDYTLHIVPYSDMYLSVLFGNSPAPSQIRAKAGQEYTIECPYSTMDDTAILIYCASRIQGLNDLSACYIHDNDFSKATRLQTLIIGSDVEGYSNSFLTTLNLGNNALLETLDIRNCPNLTGLINLASCGNLVTFHATGTVITGVTFANNGKITNAYLPATLRSLVMRNLTNLTNLNVESYNSLETLTLDIKVDDDGTSYDTVDSLSIIGATTTALQNVRLTGIDWELEDTTLLNNLLQKYNVILSGKVYIVGPIRDREINQYAAAWPDLEVLYSPENLIEQYTLTFVNTDDTVLFVQYVDRGSDGYDPLDPNGDGDRDDAEIEVPTKEPTEAEVYTYRGWEGSLTQVISDRIIYASYDASPRMYTVTWYSMVGIVLKRGQFEYGSEAVYDGPVPTRTEQEVNFTYFLFNGWDKSTGYITGDMDVYANWMRGELPVEGTTLGEMNEAQLYGICKAKRSYEYAGMKDNVTIQMGYTPIYPNVEYVDLITEETTFNATEEAIIHTGEYPMMEDTGWTLVVDFMFTNSTANAALVSCWDSATSDGFQIRYNSNATARWGNLSTASSLGAVNQRQIVVLRHKKGDNNLYVYRSNVTSRNELSIENNRQIIAFSRAQRNNFELIFGGQGVYGGYYETLASGKIYYSRLYRADMGDEDCLKMASWPVQSYDFEAYGYRPSGSTNIAYSNYALVEGEGRASIDFISKNLLTWTYQMNTSNTNVGGWDQCIMRPWLNRRFYMGLPQTWRQILKKVYVKSSIGGGSSSAPSTTVPSPGSADYIRIPCLTEMNNSSSDPYSLEGVYIPWFTNDASRAKKLDNGAGAASYWWLRSPNATTSTSFWNVFSSGGVITGSNASGAGGAAPCFSI